MAFFRNPFEFIIVDAFVFLADAIGDDIEILAAHIDRAAMAEVTAIVEAHTHEGVTGLHEGEEYGHICLSTRMGLDVGIAGTK